MLFYWDWIIIVLCIATFSSTIACILGTLQFWLVPYLSLNLGSCPGCSTGRKGSSINRVNYQIRSMINVTSPVHDGGWTPSEGYNIENSWDALFQDDYVDIRPTFYHDTPLGLLQLQNGVIEEWIPSSCESRIFAGCLNDSLDCWLIIVSHSINKRTVHPLEKEYLIATVLAELNVCPNPLYLSPGIKSIYGSFTEVEERYMLYPMAPGSKFLTQLAFREAPLPLKKLCGIFVVLIAAVKKLHTNGLAHCALVDDGVVVVNEREVLLVNLSNISTQESDQHADLLSLIELFCYLASRGYAWGVRDLRSHIMGGKSTIKPSFLRYFDQLESVPLTPHPHTCDRMLKCIQSLMEAS